MSIPIITTFFHPCQPHVKSCLDVASLSVITVFEVFVAAGRLLLLLLLLPSSSVNNQVSRLGLPGGDEGGDDARLFPVILGKSPPQFFHPPSSRPQLTSPHLRFQTSPTHANIAVRVLGSSRLSQYRRNPFQAFHTSAQFLFLHSVTTASVTTNIFIRKKDRC